MAEKSAEGKLHEVGNAEADEIIEYCNLAIPHNEMLSRVVRNMYARIVQLEAQVRANSASIVKNVSEVKQEMSRKTNKKISLGKTIQERALSTEAYRRHIIYVISQGAAFNAIAIADEDFKAFMGGSIGVQGKATVAEALAACKRAIDGFIAVKERAAKAGGP